MLIKLKSQSRRGLWLPNSMLMSFKTLVTDGHVHKYEAVFGCFMDILMAVTFLSIVLFQKQNQKIVLCES